MTSNGISDRSEILDPARYEYFTVALRGQPEEVLRPIAEGDEPEAKAAALMILAERKAEFRKTSSKKRGRPSLLSAYDAETAELLDSFGTQSTKRGKQNHYYYILGAGALPEGDPRFAWLYEGHEVRRTILSELGRLGQVYDKESVRGIALKICEAKMTTRQAVRALRKIRDVKKPGDDTDAAMAIRTAVNNYFKSHPDFTVEQMRDALRVVLHAVEELCAK